MVTNPDLTDGGDREGDSPVAADLVTRARNGDKQAWDALVERYSPLIWSICRRRGLSDADAQDVGRSVWLKLVSQLATIRVPAALPGWLAATTRRECGRILRVVPGAPDTGQAGDARAIPDDHAPAAEEDLLAAELHAADNAARTEPSPVVRPDQHQAGHPGRQYRLPSRPLPGQAAPPPVPRRTDRPRRHDDGVRYAARQRPDDDDQQIVGSQRQHTRQMSLPEYPTPA
jgi:Sigma-70 region 2